MRAAQVTGACPLTWMPLPNEPKIMKPMSWPLVSVFSTSRPAVHCSHHLRELDARGPHSRIHLGGGKDGGVPARLHP
jgi:hypothetical protein